MKSINIIFIISLLSSLLLRCGSDFDPAKSQLQSQDESETVAIPKKVSKPSILKVIIPDDDYGNCEDIKNWLKRNPLLKLKNCSVDSNLFGRDPVTAELIIPAYQKCNNGFMRSVSAMKFVWDKGGESYKWIRPKNSEGERIIQEYFVPSVDAAPEAKNEYFNINYLDVPCKLDPTEEIKELLAQEKVEEKGYYGNDGKFFIYTDFIKNDGRFGRDKPEELGLFKTLVMKMSQSLLSDGDKILSTGYGGKSRCYMECRNSGSSENFLPGHEFSLKMFVVTILHKNGLIAHYRPTSELVTELMAIQGEESAYSQADYDLVKKLGVESCTLNSNDLEKLLLDNLNDVQGFIQRQSAGTLSFTSSKSKTLNSQVTHRDFRIDDWQYLKGVQTSFELNLDFEQTLERTDNNLTDHTASLPITITNWITVEESFGTKYIKCKPEVVINSLSVFQDQEARGNQTGKKITSLFMDRSTERNQDDFNFMLEHDVTNALQELFK